MQQMIQLYFCKPSWSWSAGSHNNRRVRLLLPLTESAVRQHLIKTSREGLQEEGRGHSGVPAEQSGTRNPGRSLFLLGQCLPWVKLCPPPKYMMKPLHLVPLNVTLFENRVFVDIIRCKLR